MASALDRITDYEPPLTGELFMKSDAKVRLIMGPVGSGKSTVSIVEIFRRCAEMPKCKDGYRRSRWVVIRNTNQQLKQTTLKSWLQWFPNGVAGTWRESDKTFLLEVGDIKAEILFLPLDTPDDTQRLLSLELSGAFINEAREVAPEIIQAVFSRLGRYPSRAMLPKDPQTGKAVDYWYGLIMDTNPPSRDSFLYEQFEELKPDGWEIFKQPGGLEDDAENKENLPPTYYEDMMNGATDDWIDVHVHGKYGKSIIGRPVFENTFNREFHVAPGVLNAVSSDQYTILIGQDFGRTPAAVIGQRDWRGRLNVLDALYVENIGLENFLNLHLKPLLRERFPHNKYLIIGDPAGWAKSQYTEENAYDIIRKCGLHAVKAPTNDTDKRIQAVERLLSQQVDGKAMMLFSNESTSPGMKHLITAMDGGYKYKRKSDGSYESSPQKDKFSHCFMAGTIVSTPEGGVSIEALSVGDYVSTPFGARKVTATMGRYAVDMVELTFADGAVFTCTTDHPIYTLAGIALSEAVQYNEVLLREGENRCAQPNTPCSSSTVSDSTDARPVTTTRTSGSMEPWQCTGMCGSVTTVRSLMGHTSTTSTATKRTTALRILSACLQPSTVKGTLRSVSLQTRNGLSQVWKKLGSRLLSGTAVKKVVPGIASTGNRHGSGVRKSSLLVSTAGNRLHVFVEQTRKGIAALRAKAWPGSNQELMTSQESALFAEVVSELTSTGRLKRAPKIVGVRHYQLPKPVPVYDITVEEVHSFFAHGVWVSNCADATQYLALGADLSGGGGQRQAVEIKPAKIRWACR